MAFARRTKSRVSRHFPYDFTPRDYHRTWTMLTSRFWAIARQQKAELVAGNKEFKAWERALKKITAPK